MRIILSIVALAAAAPASADVVASSPNGFHLRHSATLETGADAAYRRFTDIGAWWSDSHSYSGKAANMTMDAKAGGCFCEALPSGGSVEHMRVAFADPGKRIVLTGSLGPLLSLATVGAMDVRYSQDGARTLVTVDYRVAGFATGGAEELAPIVDDVIGEQVRRFAAPVR